jgi:peptidoglycan L-alanyl-D-glutamate endopeptidase CwlK
MPRFSKRSLIQLESCHIVLQRLLRRVIERTDFTVICGFRNQSEQTKAYEAGASKLQFPHSRHNISPSCAVDLAPWPIDWKDIDRFKELGRIVKEEWNLMPESERLRYILEWGGDWLTFRDLPHFQIVFGEGLNPPKR